ncbi:hypothetical protein [Spirosoma aerolatum]|uniref:hypothetical protein n=1 Tax=Spirosoma aerolatum TaxID=1211326 RepID=UPI0009ACD60F|nr:hypothetical protein [Spirosoma aerolatum]
MEFFIPFAASEAQTQRILKRISDNLRGYGYQLNQGFFYQVSYAFEGALVSDTVGEASSQNKEIVLAIFRQPEEYLICTYSRGVTWGKPMVAHSNDIQLVTAFNSE